MFRSGLAILFLLPTVADAHLVTTGLGPLYDGVGHFFLSLEDVLPVVALALWAGLRGAAHGRRVLWVLPLAWFAGGAAAQMAPGGAEFAWAGVTLLVLGVLLAADAKLPPWAVLVLAIAVGVVHGFANGVALGAGPEPLLALAGIALVVFVLVALATGGVIALRLAWTRIAVRVAGSWIAATGLLLLGWMFRRGA